MSRPDHPVFHGPVPVPMDVRQTPTPKHYRDWTFDDLPESLPTLAILARPQGPDIETPEGEEPPVPGLVTDGAGFTDTPDAEIIAGGIHHKGPDYVAIARQGRLLQWGFAGSPDEMTEAGRAVFVNALAHVVRHGRDPVIGHRESEPRDGVAAYLALLDGADAERRERLLQVAFGDDVPAEASGDRAARAAWFAAARPYLAYDPETETFAIDEDARALGIANHDPALLRRAVEDLEAGRDSDRALRLLRRYTARDFATPGQWRGWLDDAAPKLIFSDVWGYRFRIPGEGPALSSSRPSSSADAVGWELMGWSNEGHVSAMLSTRIASGYHVYLANATEPSITKLRVRLPEGSPFTFVEEPELPAPRGGHASGHFVTKLSLRGTGDELVLLVDYQACTEKSCLPPVAGQAVRLSLADE